MSLVRFAKRDISLLWEFFLPNAIFWQYVILGGDSLFSDRLKQLRREKELTQAQLAAELNVASGTIAMWETGKREPNFAITMGIADFFSTSTDFLLGYSSSPPQETLPPMEMTPAEDALLYTYRVASPDDREIIDNIIRRYSPAEQAKNPAQGHTIFGNRKT